MHKFLKAHQSSQKDLFKRKTERGDFYFIKTKTKELLSSETLKEIIVNSIASIKWKKSMRWADSDLLWGRPLRSILAVYNKKVLPFNYGHLKANEYTFIEKDLDIKSKKVLNFSEYQKLLLNNNIILDQEKRKKIITNKLEYFCKQKN